MFNVGRPVTGKNFFDRSKMVKKLVAYIDDGQDVMVKAPRRYGKTSLIKQAFAVAKKDCIYVDLRRERNLSSVAEIIVDRAYESAGMKGFVGALRKSVVDLLGRAEKELSVDLGIVKASVKLFEQKDTKGEDELLAAALDNIFELASSLERRFYIVFDEFQDIGRFGVAKERVLDRLRGTIQHHAESVSYYFLGSIETIMSEIFENRKSPFYNYCRRMSLEPFDTAEIKRDLLAAFKKRKIVFEDEDALDEVLEKLSGHPANTMVVMQNLYYLALEKDIKTIKKRDLNKAYMDGYDEVLDLIEEYIGEIKARKHHHDVIYRLANGLEQELKGAALRQVLRGLENMGHVTRTGRGEYRINDGFLIEYLRE
ncbi:hypothetical protein NNO_1992 [Hydrogenimonas sp.]|nr:hypothetical protein NNO_1992 [Hydrogenimonas sp.]